jgi:hypothetical protein
MFNTTKILFSQSELAAIFLGIGSTVWNSVTNDQLAKATGVLIFFLVVRKVVMAIVEDVRRYVLKRSGNTGKDDDVLDEENELTNEIN